MKNKKHRIIVVLSISTICLIITSLLLFLFQYKSNDNLNDIPLDLDFKYNVEEIYHSNIKDNENESNISLNCYKIVSNKENKNELFNKLNDSDVPSYMNIDYNTFNSAFIKDSNVIDNEYIKSIDLKNENNCYFYQGSAHVHDVSFMNISSYHKSIYAFVDLSNNNMVVYFFELTYKPLRK